MQSPSLREATKLCFQVCCPNPTILKMPEPEQTSEKTRNTSATCRKTFATNTTSSFFPNTHFTNHESIPSLQESFVQFIKAYPKYSDTAPVDRIRAKDYPHLSESNHISLDYIGVGLFAQSQIKSPSSQKPDFPLFGITFKSVNLKSQLLHGGQGSKLETAIKNRIMDFLNISENDYSMVFTANRSSAFKLVSEVYPFQTTKNLLTVYDHSSEALDGMIATSEKRGARVMEAEFKYPRLRIHSSKLKKMIETKKKNNKKKKSKGLFVFPLHSRITGTSYSYQWMTTAQENGWHVLLDACALGPKDMASFGLSLIRPDFLICSFYKIFGENPTGFGCLFVKKSTIQILEDSTGAGIVSIVPAKDFLRFPEDSSGTDTEIEQIRINQEEINVEEKPEQSEIEKCIVPFNEHEISNIECKCLDHVDSLGLRLINSRGRYLINWLITALMKLQHPNRLDNFPLVTIYGPKVKFERGPALAFNLYDWKGEKVEPLLVQKLADRSNISLGHGFLHRVWFTEKHEADKARIMEKNSTKQEMGRMKGRKSDEGISVVTVALTFLANFEDLYRLWTFVSQFLDADFVEKERWRYTSLNQKTIEV